MAAPLERVSVVGLGHMGTAIAERVLARDVSPPRLQPLTRPRLGPGLGGRRASRVTRSGTRRGGHLPDLAPGRRRGRERALRPSRNPRRRPAGDGARRDEHDLGRRLRGGGRGRRRAGRALPAGADQRQPDCAPERHGNRSSSRGVRTSSTAAGPCWSRSRRPFTTSARVSALAWSSSSSRS